MSRAEWKIVLGMLAFWLAGMAFAFTWAAIGYPGWALGLWLACWGTVFVLVGFAIRLLARQS